MLNKTLIKIRKSLGYSSARAFYFELLKKSGAIDFNYNYYTKIESSSALPSPEIISSISKAIAHETYSDELITSYCATLFPAKAYLFNSVLTTKLSPVQNQTIGTLQKQKYLTIRQIHVLSATENHYYLFLIATLARFPVELKKIEAAYFKGEDLTQIVSDLAKADIITFQNKQISSSVKESKFPQDVSNEVRGLYRKFDIWDLSIGKKFGLDKVTEKHMTRRISSRYRDVIKQTASLLIDLTRVSDETSQTLNDTVISFSLTLHEGKVIG